MSQVCVVHPVPPPLPSGVVSRVRLLSTSLVSDVFGRWAGAPGILPVAGLAPGAVVAGPALTVRTRPGDNLVVHAACEVATPGDVLVVAAGGATDRSILGGLLGYYAATKGIVGLVVDGAVRDLTELASFAPPTFATGVTHVGPYKDGPGEIRCPVSIGGLPVMAGDLVIADEDGIAVVPYAQVKEIVKLAEEKGRAEEAEHAAIAAGTWDRSWLAKSLDLRFL